MLSTLAVLMVASVAAGTGEPAGAPHNAFSKTQRDDLLQPLQQEGEVRVIVGLETPEEIARHVDRAPDPLNEQLVSSRQLRVLQRLAGHSVRDPKLLRHHYFMAITVDAAALAALLADPEVSSVTKDRPNYPVLNDTPAITRTDRAWAEGFRGSGQIVAVLDTGVDGSHPLLMGRVVAEACFSQPHRGNTSYCPDGAAQGMGPGTARPCPDHELGCWHGTHVAGVAAGNYGVLGKTTGGIAPDASIIAIQVFQRRCVASDCTILAYDSDIIAALDHVYSLRNAYSIAAVNVSLGGEVYGARCDAAFPAYKSVIASLEEVDIATVIAAGNNGNPAGIAAPACVSNAISVGSTTKQNGISSFSNNASFLSLLAPGSDITSAVPGGYGTADGTSIASAHVTGAWAVLKSVRPAASVSEVLATLANTGVPITDPRSDIVNPLIQTVRHGSHIAAFGRLQGAAPSGVSLTVSPASVAAGANVTATWSGIAAPSPSDWLGLYRPGAADTGYIAWIYVSCSKTAGSAQAGGACPFVIPANLPAGSYELRLFANDSFARLASSGTFSVTAVTATVLSASPTSLTAGDTISASWSGIAAPSATDWIGLFAPGAANRGYITWIYVSCSKTAGSANASGTCPFIVPDSVPSGSYELRLFTNDSFTRLATSGTFTVGTTSSTVLSVSPTSIAAGGTITASWSGIATPSSTDWIGLFAPGAVNTGYITWIYVSCSKTTGSARASGTCPFVIPNTVAAGDYELRLLANDGFTHVAISPRFTITPSRLPVLSLHAVAEGVSSPVGIEHAGDGSGRLFVVQQGGQIRVIDGGQLLPTPFLDISPSVVSGGERGLLGLAFHPSYASNGFFYVHYTRRSDGASVIARYQRSTGDANIADGDSGSVLLTIGQPFANHNGGQLRFGPDGYLYISAGDGGSANDPGNRAQNLSTLLGKLLRIDVDNAAPYAVPATNPFAGDGNPNIRGEIWAYGLRNPWRFSFDRATGDLFIADVGQSAREEVNFQPAGSAGGVNYGWRVMEGGLCTGLGGGPPCFEASLTLPILEYSHSLGCSVTGGHRYRGSASPALTGYYVFGDFCSGRIWGAAENQSGAWSADQLLAAGFNISTFGEDESGELYIAAYNTGVIYRIAAQ